MPANRNALVRYKTIDACLRNRFRKWTLEDLIEKVSETLYEYEGIDKGISARTIQADIQMMRSDKLGYFAPIIVVDKKYYTYEDPTYSITKLPISRTDLSKLNEAVELLKQFKGFSHFNQLNEVVQKLEDHVYSTVSKKQPVIYFEKNENLRGLAYLDILYNAIIHQKTIEITYQSFKAKQPNSFYFHVWWLKEFKNRWFAVGIRGNKHILYHLALDRIQELKVIDEIPYNINKAFNSETYYNDVIGVTVAQNQAPEKIILFAMKDAAPYVETKPLHHSQEILERTNGGIIISLCVQVNFELIKEILSFGNRMLVVSPLHLKEKIAYSAQRSAHNYENLTTLLPESQRIFLTQELPDSPRESIR